MTDCAHEECSRDSVGIVLWQIDDDALSRPYCQKHIRETKIDFPELIKEVRLT